MTFTKAEIEAVMRRTPAQREALDAWWRSLSPQQQQAYLDERQKDREYRETASIVIVAILILALVVAPMLAVAASLLF